MKQIRYSLIVFVLWAIALFAVGLLGWKLSYIHYTRAGILSQLNNGKETCYSTEGFGMRPDLWLERHTQISCKNWLEYSRSEGEYNTNDQLRKRIDELEKQLNGKTVS